MQLYLLAEKPQAIHQIATWYSNEWGYIGEGRSVGELELKLKEYLNHDKLPLIMVAFDKGTFFGAAQLRCHEMDIYPQREHWLGGVYVAPSSRGIGVGKALVEAIIEKAKALGVTSINLQTEDISGGLYRSLGWQTVEQVTYHGIDVLVMEKSL
ncbi:GNAT family N-acetyltransferase [Shewanella sp. Choline-02u-19]|uniref:GNAT family N-acetyltransferase n=1 Tax=unclassified Shewanella TaxID=196818 RepID=UPI000C3388E8|nr:MULTISPECIES: GNAT family N-acetyltransferase [unclassified Shewanella]PKG75519.1 GNAT family N-acetyltransferase [Shewanella sp. GutCb]PKH63210.1 GNAT family N-acetyltransferase [Shewanella sp. Bg11-22]PKI30730.1 GNAT family N-acetyltransferase [Shewanella sp. Choline-02u-19]